jgi:hypothetical protein
VSACQGAGKWRDVIGGAASRGMASATNFPESINSAQTGVKRCGTTQPRFCEVSVLPAYRIYELRKRRRVIRPALVLIRENDADVIRTVKPPVDGHDVEIMEGARVVARLSNRQIVAEP